MIVTHVAVAVLCFLGSVRGGALPPDPEPCPDDEPCDLPIGDPTARCVQGECGFYIDNPNDNQCPYDNTHTLLAHPTDCHRYCRCDHSGTAICDMPCAPGTKFDGKLQVCVHDDGCSDHCGSNPCVHCQTCVKNWNVNAQLPTPWTCPTCNDGCWGWNCQFCGPVEKPCEQHVCCPPGWLCINEVSQWWPVKIPYTCVADPCDPNPCHENGECVPINNGRNYRCICPPGCYGKNCDCQRPDPCDDNCGNDACTSPNRDATGRGICGTFTCHPDQCTAACTGMNNVNVPHPNKCDHYCACGFGTSNEMPCPDKLFFNPITCQCSDWACTQHLNQIHA